MKEFEIRNSRNGSWYWVNTAVNACKHISFSDKCVYGALCSFDGCDEIRPSFDIIAERSNTSLRKAKYSIKKLIKVGLVEMIQGGGKGRANIYNLLKCIKGCKFCTVYKGCNLRPETVQKKTTNGAESAPQLDKELNKKKDIAKTSFAEEFNLKIEIEKLQTSKREDLKIIGWYLEMKWRYCKYNLTNKQQLSSFIKRNLRSAKLLLGYSSDQFLQTSEALIKNANYSWTLETISKFINNPSEIKPIN